MALSIEIQKKQNVEKQRKVCTPDGVFKLEEVQEIKDAVQEHLLFIGLDIKNNVRNVSLLGVGNSNSIEIEFVAEISTHEEVVEVNITNESEKPDVDIEKDGIIQTTANQEIRYDFKLKNTGNVPLSNFTWYDYLPSEYVKISKLITGTYNQDLNYSIYYKTNLNDYRLLVENLNTQVNNYIDFSNIELKEGEIITDFKVDFGTVDIGFESVINPYIFVIVNSTVNNDDIFTNKTRIEGENKGYLVWNEDDHTTKVYEKEIKVKKLPRTGC